jgi:YegS/Rv2252/BmrU family lipid kinase
MHAHGTAAEAAVSDAAAAPGERLPAATARALVIIHNPTAGRRRGHYLARVMAALAAEGVAAETLLTAARGDARRLAQAESARGRTIAVAGGDGTINEAINGIAGAGAARAARLAIIPLGTANVLANELGLPKAPAAVARIAAGDATRAIHLGKIVGGGVARRFAMMAGVGFDAHVVANLPVPLKRALARLGAGKLAYAWQTLVEWLRLRPRRYRVVADGAVYHCASAIIAKGHFYAGRYVAAPEAALERDSFELVLFERGGRAAVLRYALALGLGRLAKAKGIRIVRAREIAIDGEASEPVHADGDAVSTLPVRVSIAKERLAVACPAR